MGYRMVYCSKCGTKNDEAEEYCIRCGAKLNVSIEKSWEKRIEEEAEEFGRRVEKWGRDFGKHTEEECFGLPQGGYIFGLIIGIIIIFVGILSLIGMEFWRSLWTITIITFGVLILGGAVYSLIRKD